MVPILSPKIPSVEHRPSQGREQSTRAERIEGAAGLTREHPRVNPEASASSRFHALFRLGALSQLLRARTDEGLVRGFLAHDEHGAVGVAYHRVGDAAEQSSPEASEPAASQDD
jgi:hypothetical protein